MTLPDVFRLFAYLKDNPSERQLVMIIAAMLGWKPPPPKSATSSTPARNPTAAEIRAMFPGGIMKG
jgi:hypothetical protein